MSKAHKCLLLKVAEIYGEGLTESRLNQYADLFTRVPIQDFELALKSVMLDPEVRRFPLPAAIMKHLGVTVTDEQMAVEAAARIVTAVSRFGWNNEDQAQKYVGELGWAVVAKQGGWKKLCENLAAAQVGIFQAQARELAKTQLAFARAGRLDSPPSLPQPSGSSASPKLQSGEGMTAIAKLLPQKT